MFYNNLIINPRQRHNTNEVDATGEQTETQTLCNECPSSSNVDDVKKKDVEALRITKVKKKG